MIDQGSKVEIMYPDLYKRLGLKDKDFTKYDIPLVGFEWKMVMPKGQIKFPVVAERKEVMVNFIVIHAFSIHGNLGTTIDPCHGGYAIHATIEGEVPY